MTTAVHLPLFLLGGLAVLLREDITALDEARLGVLASIFFAVSAMTSLLAGRISDHRGPRFGMVVAVFASATSLAVIATSVGLMTLAVGCVLAGVANGIGQPAANHSLARGIRGGRQGVAFGIKQSSVPASGLVAGVSVPLIGLTLGWRVTLVLGTLAILLIIVTVPRHYANVARSPVNGNEIDAPRLSLYILMGAVACGAAAGNAIPAFFVLSAVDAGRTASIGGLLLAVGGVVGIVSRLLVGWFADRRGQGHLRVVATMLALGAVGYVLLSMSQFGLSAIIGGTVLAFGAGWGWPGLMLLATIRLFPSSPGAATGKVLAGAAIGGVVGPSAVGIVARSGGFTRAWLLVAALSATASVLMVICRGSVTRWRARHSAPLNTPG